MRALRLRIKAALHRVVFAILNICSVSPMLLSRNRLLRFFVFEAIGRSRYRGLLISGNDETVFVHHSRDRGPGRELFIRGTQDFAKYQTACRLLRENGMSPVNTLIDIGANIGTICIPALKRGLAVRVIAVEAVPGIARLLHANIVLNDLTSAVTIVVAAVSARAGETIVMAVEANNQGDNRVVVAGPGARAEADTVAVVSTTVDDLLMDGAKDALIWMDIQGHEGIALSGAPRTLAQRVPLVLEFCPYLMDQGGSYTALKSAVAGYRGFYDLAHPAEMRPMAALDALYEALGPRGNFTDILVL